MSAILRTAGLGLRALHGMAGAAATATRRRFPSQCEGLLAGFRNSGRPDEEAYERLFLYFLEGWLAYRGPGSGLARYPGLGSWSGPRVDALEGFSRMAPLWAAWMRGGRSSAVERSGGSAIDLAELFVAGVSTGTDPFHPGYWGDIRGESDQRIVEAADIALALWLFSEAAWNRMTADQRDRLMGWLAQCHGRRGLDNNWHLFFILIDRVQRAFGYPGGDPDEIRDRWNRIRSFHIGDGWFRDGPSGPVDYYNVWGFHYPMHWVNQIDPEWDPEFIARTSRAFTAGYRYLLGPGGFPILGRSVPYRIAAPVPQVIVQAEDPCTIPPGEARRVLDAVWSYFIRNGAVRQGAITQGYHGTDPRLLDNYSGPASPLWSLRSLVVALAQGPRAALWKATPEPLPIERGSYELVLDAPGWRVEGDSGSGMILIEVLANTGSAGVKLEPYRLRDRLRAAGHGRPLRPDNVPAKYRRRFYGSSGRHLLTEPAPGPLARKASTFLFPY